MLKPRIVGTLIIKSGIVVQSIGFRHYLPIGAPEIAIEYLNQWGIDEIIILDIDATPLGREPLYEKIEQCSKYCQVPLSVGGGINQLSEIEKLLSSGADKVVINTEAALNPNFITEGAKSFGRQCLIASIDAKKISNSQYEVFTCSGKHSQKLSPAALAQKYEDCGAGEIMVTSIDNDGSKKGYDLELLRQVKEVISVPIIASGGVSHPHHFLEALEMKIEAAAAANFFHYTEHSVIAAKSYLRHAGFDVRIDTYATYDDYDFNTDTGRIKRKQEDELIKLRFEYVPEEKI